MTEKRRKFWGWGWEGEGLTDAELKRIDSFWASQFGAKDLEVTAPPEANEIELRASRIHIPPSLEGI